MSMGLRLVKTIRRRWSTGLALELLLAGHDDGTYGNVRDRLVRFR